MNEAIDSLATRLSELRDECTEEERMLLGALLHAGAAAVALEQQAEGEVEGFRLRSRAAMLGRQNESIDAGMKEAGARANALTGASMAQLLTDVSYSSFLGVR